MLVSVKPAQRGLSNTTTPLTETRYTLAVAQVALSGLCDRPRNHTTSYSQRVAQAQAPRSRPCPPTARARLQKGSQLWTTQYCHKVYVPYYVFR